MEKRTPHCKLATVKALIEADRAMCDVVLGLTTADFYKSMTTHANHQIWQDVYHGRTPDGTALYIKLTVIDDVLIVSFKEL